MPAIVVGILLGSNLSLPAAPSDLRGNLGIHDPSAVIPCNGRYYVFGTGQGILSKSSADLTYWAAGPSVFANSPVWTTNDVPGFTGFFWAPDITYFNGLYHLYYAVSTFGSQVSAIGLATNPTLDPGSPAYQWTDQGPVIRSLKGYAYNCIDPSVTFDASSNLWMSFGSFWNGIYAVQLDPVTGLVNPTNSTPIHEAFNTASGDPIEASYLYHHGNYYYLFVNWGTCCAGVNSTYNIRVGRSTRIFGPYVDHNGVAMNSGGGTLFLKTTGKFIGPGQMGILEGDGTEYFGYHYYDGNNNGAPTFDVEPLSWTPDGWPTFTNDWSALYHFHMDASDDNGQYYGLMNDGADVYYDPLLGNVLNLNGTNQFVSLPGGAANACSFITVFKWNGGLPWQRVFDFGRGTNSYAFLTPQNAAGVMRFAITASGIGGEQLLDAPGAAPVGAWTQVAVTTDGSQGIMYVNGTPVATNTSMTLTAPDIAPTNVWFGRSQFPADPYFNGQVGSIRLYGRALAPAEIVAPQPHITAPTAQVYFQPGSVIPFAGSAVDYADVPLSTTDLTWTIEFCGTNATNVVLGPLAGVGGGSLVVPSDPTATNGFYRILLAAADAMGHTATNSVNVLPGPTNGVWMASYPFDNGAADANGNFNGTLVNGASSVSDPIRGPVLNLSGASQYVSLPSGIGALRTFSAWVKWNGGNAWQRIFDFGTGTGGYAMLTTKANTGALQFQIAADNGNAVWSLDAPNPLPVGIWTHVAVALDGGEAVMYVNGQAVAVNASTYVLPSDVEGAQNFLGRSQFPADPYFNGQMDSVQISSQTLSVEQITASSLGLSGGSASLTLNWPAFNNGLELYRSPGLGSGALWTPVAGAPTATNGINFLSLTPTNSQTFFRLQTPW
ncbi:MAG TPA: LamG-like jellyroll fold domain-containing protein [Verrucomicrobiae bacterium]|nr:LamG-like jellyroll fold domain-containing protein [Verrucomicrobiae bacterium]